MSRRWVEREDELSRTIFAGQLSIDGEEHAETTVTPKKRAVRGEGSSRTASSIAGEESRNDGGDTPMFDPSLS